MTSRERLMSIFQGQAPDRPAIKLWSASPSQKARHPAYEPVLRLAVEATDLMVSAGSPFNLHWGTAAAEISKSQERPTDSPEWVEVVTHIRTADRTLQSIHTKSTVGKPGYQKEHLFKEPDDIRRMLAVPYQPHPFSADSFRATEKAVGERGVAMFSLDHAMYGLERMIGSENFALWSLERRDLLTEAIEALSRRICEHVKRAFEAGLKPIFAWVGPELCIPPLMSPRDFEDFVFRFDKPLCDLIHEGGGYVWVHCHGKMGPVLERFVAMGVDVLNPIEPPPMGDVTLAQAFDRVGDRMGLEGGIETHDLMMAAPEHIRKLVREAMAAGRGRRFILCPSSGYMEVPVPEDRFIQNLMAYLEEGLRCAEEAASLG
ncbi:MAG: uroporphyrinogen decarboxylase family protein [Planctomycetota bacterium]